MRLRETKGTAGGWVRGYVSSAKSYSQPTNLKIKVLNELVIEEDLDRIFPFGITLNNTPDFLHPTLIWFAELVCDLGSPFINNSVGSKLIILARPMLWFRR